MAKTDGAGFASHSENSFILLFPFLLESCSYVNGFDNFCVGKRQADLSRSGSGHLIGDYRYHFLFSFLIRNQLRNAVGRGGNIKFVSSFCTNISLVPSLMDFKVRK